MPSTQHKISGEMTHIDRLVIALKSCAWTLNILQTEHDNDDVIPVTMYLQISLSQTIQRDWSLS